MAKPHAGGETLRLHEEREAQPTELIPDTANLTAACSRHTGDHQHHQQNSHAAEFSPDCRITSTLNRCCFEPLSFKNGVIMQQ